jgi:hypothetical protein
MYDRAKYPAAHATPPPLHRKQQLGYKDEQISALTIGGIMPGREAMPKISNGGRWGKNDEKGTANFITPEVIIAAAKLVRKGKVICCCIPIDQFGPVFPTRTSAQRFMSVLNVPIKEIGMPGQAIVNDDYITMYLQGSTQWDSLSHVGYGDRFYNDLPTSAVTAHWSRQE